MGKNKDKIVEQYEKLGRQLYLATIECDYKTCNKIQNKFVKTFKLLEKNINLAKECISTMLDSTNNAVRIEAAAYCLAMNIYTDKAITILQTISTTEKSNLWAENARLTLEGYREKGTINIYQK